MMCWTCGHLKKHHYPVPNWHPSVCMQCRYANPKNEEFSRHEFEDNLTYLERKAKEKESKQCGQRKGEVIK